MILCDVEGLRYDEIAEVTRSSLGTVKSRISRGRSRMRVLLSGEGEPFEGTLRHEDEQIRAHRPAVSGRRPLE